MNLRSPILACSVLFVATACSPDVAVAPDAGAPSPPSEVDNGPVSDDTVFTETSVWTDETGMHSKVRTITAGEERAQNEAREHPKAGGPTPLIAKDDACAGPSFWLYDRTDLKGNRICFAGEGHTDLSTYMRFLCSTGPIGDTCLWWPWTLQSGSYYAGSSSGALEGDVPGSSTPPHLPDARTTFGIYFQPYQHDSFTVGPKVILGLTLWH